MRPYSASLVNAAVLIGAGLWDFLATGGLSLTSIMPFAAGLVLVALNGGLRKENKTIAHVLVLLTLFVVVVMAVTLASSIGRSDGMAALRAGLIVLSGLFAMVYFIRSFIQARKNRVN